jgi:MFS transporter, ACS family, glucarate transporter
MSEYGFSSVQMGWIFSTFVLGYAVLHVPCGWLADRFGATRVLMVSILFWSLFTVLTPLAGSAVVTSILGGVGGFSVIRVLLGFGEAAVPPCVARAIADWMQPSERGLGTGVAYSGLTAGGVAAPPVIVWIVANYGWRAAFYIGGFLGLLLVAAWYATIGKIWRRSPGVASVRVGSASDTKSSLRSSAGEVSWRDILGRRDLWCLMISFFSCGYVLYLYFTWFFLYLVTERGLDSHVAGLCTSAPFAVSTVSAPVGGWITDRLTRRFGPGIGCRTFGMVGLFLSGIFLLLGADSSATFLAVALFSLAAGFLYLSVSTYWVAIIHLFKDHCGAATGFVNIGVDVGGVLCPILTPIIAARYGWHASLYFAVAVALVGALFWLGVDLERRLEVRERVVE